MGSSWIRTQIQKIQTQKKKKNPKKKKKIKTNPEFFIKIIWYFPLFGISIFFSLENRHTQT